MTRGTIERVSGPIIFAKGLEGAGLYDVVNVGKKKLMGEIIRQNQGSATIQVYEDVTGLKVGEEIECE
ncbi:MAG: V-type ATP synthase subunit A, partial [Treponema sp.]|nr:V-type ATP synthase subunit A [Treponema sp.]